MLFFGRPPRLYTGPSLTHIGPKECSKFQAPTQRRTHSLGCRTRGYRSSLGSRGCTRYCLQKVALCFCICMLCRIRSDCECPLCWTMTSLWILCRCTTLSRPGSAIGGSSDNRQIPIFVCSLRWLESEETPGQSWICCPCTLSIWSWGLDDWAWRRTDVCSTPLEHRGRTLWWRD